MQESKKVKPVNTREVNGSVVADRYEYGKVFISEVPSDFNQKGVDFKKGSNYIRWQYRNKCPILIGEDEVLAKKGADTTEAQNQAYFALSILSDGGYVSRFQKK